MRLFSSFRVSFSAVWAGVLTVNFGFVVKGRLETSQIVQWPRRALQLVGQNSGSSSAQPNVRPLAILPKALHADFAATFAPFRLLYRFPASRIDNQALISG